MLQPFRSSARGPARLEHLWDWSSFRSHPCPPCFRLSGRVDPCCPRPSAVALERKLSNGTRFFLGNGQALAAYGWFAYCRRTGLELILVFCSEEELSDSNL